MKNVMNEIYSDVYLFSYQANNNVIHQITAKMVDDVVLKALSRISSYLIHKVMHE